MFDFRQLFTELKIDTSTRKYKDIYDRLKIYLKTKIVSILDNAKKTNRGRKRKIDWDHFFDCLFCIADNGLKMSYIPRYFNLPKSTYYYYFKLISDLNFFEIIHNEIVRNYSIISPDEYLITDTFTVKSMNGSEGLGRNPTDRGRKGLKVSLICDQNLVTHAVHLEPANVHDSKILVPTIRSSILILDGINCLADSGYAGNKYILRIKKETGVSLIAKPKKTCNKLKMSHVISVNDSEILKKKRNYIERLNGNIRNFRGLMIKYTKNLSSYTTYLYMAVMCITCHRIFFC